LTATSRTAKWTDIRKNNKNKKKKKKKKKKKQIRALKLHEIQTKGSGYSSYYTWEFNRDLLL
jgi:hypothetical protein